MKAKKTSAVLSVGNGFHHYNITLRTRSLYTEAVGCASITVSRNTSPYNYDLKCTKRIQRAKLPFPTHSGRLLIASCKARVTLMLPSLSSRHCQARMHLIHGQRSIIVPNRLHGSDGGSVLDSEHSRVRCATSSGSRLLAVAVEYEQMSHFTFGSQKFDRSRRLSNTFSLLIIALFSHQPLDTRMQRILYINCVLRNI
jgi:hypothetical protein